MVNVVLNRYKNLRHIGCLHSAGKGRIIMEYTFTAANFEEEVLQSELPVLVDFYADSVSYTHLMAVNRIL